MRKILTIIIGLALVSCNQVQNEDELKLNKKVLEQKIDSLFTNYFDNKGPAAAIYISYNSKEVIKKTYGLSNIETGEKANNKTNFRSGSLAKQFTNLTVLNLVQNGQVHLNDTVYKYFPFPIFKDVTILQLISHTSGIVDAEYEIEKTWKSNEYVKLDDIMEWYKLNNATRFSPGTQFEYNNSTYYVLVKLVENLSGMTFSDYMKKVVFDKLDMKNTYYVTEHNIDKIPQLAICYKQDSLGKWSSDEYHFLNTLIGAGGLYSNLDDYSKYLEALRNKKILEKSSHDLIFRPISMNMELHSEDMRTLKGIKSSYAMGWEVTDSLAVSAGLYYGVNNWSVYEFKRPLSFVLFSNSTIPFKERLIDKTYKIIDEHFETTTANNVY